MTLYVDGPAGDDKLPTGHSIIINLAGSLSLPQKLQSYLADH